MKESVFQLGSSNLGKRGPKKGEGGRPQGSGIGKYRGAAAKYPPEIRAAWRATYYLRKGISPPSIVLTEPSPVAKAIGLRQAQRKSTPRKKEKKKTRGK